MRSLVISHFLFHTKSRAKTIQCSYRFFDVEKGHDKWVTPLGRVFKIQDVLHDI